MTARLSQRDILALAWAWQDPDAVRGHYTPGVDAGVHPIVAKVLGAVASGAAATKDTFIGAGLTPEEFGEAMKAASEGRGEPPKQTPADTVKPFAVPRLYTSTDLRLDRDRELVSLASLPHAHGWGERLDYLTGGGLLAGDVVAVGASRAGAGKTAFVMQLADGLALRTANLVTSGQAGPLTPVVLVTELSPVALAHRTMARLLDVSPRMFRSGKVAAAYRRDVDDVYRRADELLDVGGVFHRMQEWQEIARPRDREAMIYQLTKHLAALKERVLAENPGRDVWPVVVLDPIQRWQDPKRSEVEALNQLAEDMDQLADENGWIVILTSDTNKAAAVGKEDGDRDPANIFRGSYKLQHSCDLVLALQPGPYLPETSRTVDAMIVKNRSGPEMVTARFEWQVNDRGLQFVPEPEESRKAREDAPKAKNGEPSPASRYKP